MKRSIIISIFLFFGLSIIAQQDFHVLNSTMRISGTSTLHDWSADVKGVYGSARMNLVDSELKDISTLLLKIDMSSLESMDGSLIEQKITEALKVDEHPEITFKLKHVHSIINEGNTAKVLAIGNLTIAETTKPISLYVIGKKMEGMLVFQGMKKIKMSAFNIEAPSFMLGSMHANDEVTIQFAITFSNYGLTSK